MHHFINAQHSVRTPGTEAGSAVVETLSDRKTLSDENLTLEIIPVGRNSHAQELRAFYFPRERILYLADRGALVQPLIPGNRELYYFIKREKLVVDTIYGVHWKGVPFKQLEKALQDEKKSTSNLSLFICCRCINTRIP